MTPTIYCPTPEACEDFPECLHDCPGCGRQAVQRYCDYCAACAVCGGYLDPMRTLRAMPRCECKEASK